MPLFRTKRWFFERIKDGTKTIDLRRGPAKNGGVAVFVCGRDVLRKPIVSKKSGRLNEILTEETYLRIVPSSASVEEVEEKVRMLYGTTDGEFTAYYLS
jgi:ASC-1-like (ASCH) protein